MISRFWWSRYWVIKLERCNYQKPSRRERASQKKVNVLENKVLTLESEHNSLEQYGRRNNIQITGIPNNVPDQNLEEKVVDILNEISVDVSPKDIEACHRVGVSKNNSKKTIVRFINRKHAKKELL